MNNRIVTVMIGLPGSGKSTYVMSQMLSNKCTNIVCKDDIRKALGVVFDPALEDKVDEVACIQIGALMYRRVPIIVDECNTTVESISKIRDLANKHNYLINGIYVHTPKDTCIKRRSKDNFPLDVIERMDVQLARDFGSIVKLLDSLKVINNEFERFGI